MKEYGAYGSPVTICKLRGNLFSAYAYGGELSSQNDNFVEFRKGLSGLASRELFPDWSSPEPVSEVRFSEECLRERTASQVRYTRATRRTTPEVSSGFSCGIKMYASSPGPCPFWPSC